jgi:hypothetical protein
MIGVSHDRDAESYAAKARWFFSLGVAGRMRLLDEWTDLILAANPGILECKRAEPVAGRIRVLELPRR